MRGQGRVFRPKIAGRESQVWWLDYSVRGVRYRESSGTTNKRDAFAALREKISQRQNNTLRGRPERVTLADLRESLRKHYVREGKRSWTRAEQAFTHLTEYFGEDAKAIGITRARVGDYQEARLAAEAARNTIRYEVGVLSAAFAVAVDDDGILSEKPAFKQLPEGVARSGFFEPADFAALVIALPAELADLVRFLWMTGWRRGEGVGLLWAQVTWDDPDFPGEHDEPVPGPNACVRLSEAQTKGKDAREFPIGNAPELQSLLLARWRVRQGLRVFHRAGQPIGDFRKAWSTACKTAGCEGRLVHDLRRTAARDFRKAGVSEGEVMQLCGWKTRDMFDRYNIIDAADRARAVNRRFGSLGPNGKQEAKKAAESEQDQTAN